MQRPNTPPRARPAASAPPPLYPPPPASIPALYWVALGVVVVGAGIAMLLLHRRFSIKMDEAEESNHEFKARAENYAQQRGAELARQHLDHYLRQNKGARHDVGDPGMTPGLACSSSFNTPAQQRCSAEGTAVTSSTSPLGVRLEPIPESEVPHLEPADDEAVAAE